MCVCQCVSTSHTLTEISESLISYSFPGIFSQSWSPDVTQMNVNEKRVLLCEKLKPGNVAIDRHSSVMYWILVFGKLLF